MLLKNRRELSQNSFLGLGLGFGAGLTAILLRLTME
jgi:hypothetical protein